MRVTIALWLFPLASALAAPGEKIGTVHVDHFGYRPNDPKVAILTADPGAAGLELRKLDDTIVMHVPADGGSVTAQGLDPQSGDNIWQVDFSAFNTPGSYYLAAPALSASSVAFDLADNVYNAPFRTMLQSYFYARCGEAKPASLAGVWSDPNACHTSDAATTVGGGPDDGALDLSGGYHDAGDSNKYMWDSLFFGQMVAYELAPAQVPDGALSIPENANAQSDLLDTIKVWTDWQLKMQRPNGRILFMVHQTDFAEDQSPPGSETTRRYYFDADNAGFSGNTNETATAYFIASVAQASRVFRLAGQTAYADQLLAAATLSWKTLQGMTNNDNNRRFAAAAALFSAAPTDATVLAQTKAFCDAQVDPNYWAAWPSQMAFFEGLWLYTRAADATPGQVTAMQGWLGQMVDSLMNEGGGGYGTAIADGENIWSSNEYHALRGVMLVLASRDGFNGSHSAAAVLAQAENYLHYLFGLNPLSMVYLTNTSNIGGEHSVFTPYNHWFCQSASLDYSNASYCGRPVNDSEAGWPYSSAPGADVTSQYGPAPGFVVGGPNKSWPELGAYVSDESSARDYIDAEPKQISESYDVNEIGLYYTNAALTLSALFATTLDSPTVAQPSTPPDTTPAPVGASSSDSPPVPSPIIMAPAAPSTRTAAHGCANLPDREGALLSLVFCLSRLARLVTRQRNDIALLTVGEHERDVG